MLAGSSASLHPRLPPQAVPTLSPPANTINIAGGGRRRNDGGGANVDTFTSLDTTPRQQPPQTQEEDDHLPQSPGLDIDAVDPVLKATIEMELLRNSLRNVVVIVDGVGGVLLLISFWAHYFWSLVVGIIALGVAWSGYVHLSTAKDLRHNTCLCNPLDFASNFRSLQIVLAVLGSVSFVTAVVGSILQRDRVGFLVFGIVSAVASAALVITAAWALPKSTRLRDVMSNDLEIVAMCNGGVGAFSGAVVYQQTSPSSGYPSPGYLRPPNSGTSLVSPVVTAIPVDTSYGSVDPATTTTTTGGADGSATPPPHQHQQDTSYSQQQQQQQGDVVEAQKYEDDEDVGATYHMAESPPESLNVGY